MRKYNKFVPREAPAYPHLTEANAVHAGESAFKAGIYFNNNPYKTNPCKSGWIRGFKRQEKVFFEGVRRSIAIQESLPLEDE